MNGKQLKNSILQWAIQGKLVPQDASDEPAIELLKRINPKFVQLEYDEGLPQGWSLTTMSMLCSLNDGERLQDKTMVNLDAKYLRGKSEGTILKSGRYIPSNSLLILVDGENSGEVFRTPIEGYQGSTFKRLVIDNNMNEDFVLQVINSHRAKLKENKVGSAIPHLNKKLFRETLVLVPPLAEQKRIVEKIEELMPLVERYTKAQEGLDKLNAGIKGKLRASILQEAIQGKLVPQDSNDEPAIELLKRFNPKIKPITEDVPFEVPYSWVWCSIKDVGNIVTGSTPPKANKEYYGGNIPFFKPTDLEQYRNVCTSKDHLSLLGFEKSRQLPPNSILVTCIGATIGKTGMTSIEGTCNQQINAIIPHKEIFPPYVYYACNSDFFQYNIKDNASATTLPILNKNKFADLTIPLPPLAEQKRIVEKIESLFAILDNF